MNKLNCDIVKDLIPSYLDDICSESSRKAVEEHMAECEECRSYLEAIKQTELTAGEADLKELDYMKKVRKHYTRKNAVAMGLCGIFGVLSLGLCISSDLYNKLPLGLYYLMYPVLTLGSSFLLSDYQVRPEKDIKRIGAGILSAAGIIYCIGLNVILVRSVEYEWTPWGIALNKLGPYMNRRYVAVIVAEFVLFAWFVADAIKKEHAMGVLPVISLTGSFLAMISRYILWTMAGPEGVRLFEIRVTVMLLAEFIGIVLLERIAQRLQDHKKGTAD